jgi:hypothetical protein
MDTARKEMMLELLKEKTKWNKSVVIDDLDNAISVYDGTGMITKALVESVQDVANALVDGYYITSRDNNLVIIITLI